MSKEEDKLPEGWSSATLGEILGEDRLKVVIGMVEKKEHIQLKAYLKHIRADLEKKGVDHKFLYYSICHKFKI